MVTEFNRQTNLTDTMARRKDNITEHSSKILEGSVRTLLKRVTRDFSKEKEVLLTPYPLFCISYVCTHV